jgi:hypothetical protein
MSKSLSITGRTHQFNGQEISWVGECPWTGGLCFGTYSGRLSMPPRDGPVARFTPVAEEAINDVAFAGDLMGVSARSEVAVFEGDPASGSAAPLDKPFGGGAHGIVATAAGGFVAPLGAEGLLFIDRGTEPDRPLEMRIGRMDRGLANFYKVAHLGAVEERGEVLACVARHDGLLAITLDRGDVQSPLVDLPLSGFDLVDVCSLRSPQWPLAVAVLGADRTILLSRNILEARFHLIRFNDLPGRAYSLLSAQGHLFLLTSDKMVVLPDLAARFLAGESIPDRVPSLTGLERAADAFLAYDELFFDCEDGMRSIAIDQLASDARDSRISVFTESSSVPERPAVLSLGFTFQPA